MNRSKNKKKKKKKKKCEMSTGERGTFGEENKKKSECSLVFCDPRNYDHQ